MSLFEDGRYQYRETCFVLFDRARRPRADVVRRLLGELGERYEAGPVQETEDGYFDSVSIRCPYDHSALDLSYVEGEDVTGQLDEIRQEMMGVPLSESESKRLDGISHCDARLDLFHFEELAAVDEEDELMDPGAMLVVLQHMSNLTGGIGIDPQSGTLI